MQDPFSVHLILFIQLAFDIQYILFLLHLNNDFNLNVNDKLIICQKEKKNPLT